MTRALTTSDNNDTIHLYDVSSIFLDGQGGDDWFQIAFTPYEDPSSRQSTIFGGAGDDVIGVAAHFRDPEKRSFEVTVDGGEGNDYIDLTGSGLNITFVIDAHGHITNVTYDSFIAIAGIVQGGNGDDTISLGRNGLDLTIAGGDGRDVFEFELNYLEPNYEGSGRPIPDTKSQFTITDFNVAEDRLDLYGLFNQFYIADRSLGHGYDLRNAVAADGTAVTELWVDTNNDGQVDYRYITFLGGVDATQIDIHTGTGVFGNADNNVLIASAQGSQVLGWGGDDVITGGNAADILIGGRGNDSIDGGEGDDYIFAADFVGGSQNSYFELDSGGYVLNGGAGNDHIDGTFSTGGGLIDGGDGDDTIYGSLNATILGGAGADDIDLYYSTWLVYDGSEATSNDVDNLIFGVAETLTVDLTGLLDAYGITDRRAGYGYEIRQNGQSTYWESLWIDTDNDGRTDRLLADSTNWFSGSLSTANFIVGDNVPSGALDGIRFDTKALGTMREGSSGSDYAGGSSGSDFYRGMGGNDVLNGKTGNDKLFGDSGSDRLSGGRGQDLLNGGADRDILLGDSGNDTIYGGDGNDVLNGGTGRDYLDAGAGRDIFAFGTLSNGRPDQGGDIIANFNANEDRIDLRDLMRAVDGTASIDDHGDGCYGLNFNTGDRVFTLATVYVTLGQLDQNDLIVL